MNIRNNANKFLGMALVLSVLSIWSIAQTNQTGVQKTEAEIAVTQSKSVPSLTNSQLLSSAGTIIATNNGVTITQGPGASIPEGPEPQGGWFTPIYTAEGVVKREVFSDSGDSRFTHIHPFSFSMGNNQFWKAKVLLAFSNTVSFVTCDGTNIYCLLSNGSVDEKDGKAPILSPGVLPIERDDIVGFLWTAFVSGEHLVSMDDADAAKLPNLLPGKSARDPAAWCLNFDYDLHSFSRNTLLSNGVYVLDKSRIYPDIDDYPFLDEPEGPLSKEFITGRIQCLMGVEQTNSVVSTYSTKKTGFFSEYGVPILFDAENFSLQETNNAPPVCVVRMSGIVTNVIINPQVVRLLPQITGVAGIQDKRFREKKGNYYRNYIFYRVTNEWELSVDSPRLKEIAFQRYFHKVVEPSKWIGFGYYFSIILIIILFFLPFYFSKMKKK